GPVLGAELDDFHQIELFQPCDARRMIAVLGGLGAAFMFAGTTLFSSRSAKLIGPWSVLAWVMIVGSAITLPWVAATGIPSGLDLYSTGHLSGDMPIAWALLPARLIGLIAVALPLALSSRLRLTRRAVPFVVGGGFCEVAGFSLFALGARHGIAIAAVLASQFGGIAAVLGFAVFRERLGRIQVLGVTAIVVGVAVLTGIQSG